MNRRNPWLAMMALAILLSTGICRAASAATLKIGGTGFGLEVMRILAANYKEQKAPANIVVFPSLGSSGGIKALLAGELDLAISSRPLRPAEKDQGVRETELFRTPFVFITNPTIGKGSITTEELESIYSGRLPSWPDGSRIRLVLRPRTETDTEIVRGLSPAMHEAVDLARKRPGMILAVTDQENLETMEKTPGALGGGTLAQVLSEKRRVRILKLNGLKPSNETSGDNTYPLSKTLYLVTGKRTGPAARQFVDFILSEKGRGILASYGSVARTPPGSGS